MLPFGGLILATASGHFVESGALKVMMMMMMIIGDNFGITFAASAAAYVELIVELFEFLPRLLKQTGQFVVVLGRLVIRRHQ
mgnify:CR=1 FL=1